MMKNNFIAASANVVDIDDEAKKFPIVTKVEKNINLKAVMSNSFGFGGTNATLIFEKNLNELNKRKKRFNYGRRK